MQAGMEQLARAAGEARRAATESLATQLAELDRFGGHNRERRDDELASNRAQKRARRAAASKLAGLLDGQEEPQQDPLLADENSHAGHGLHHRHHQHHHHGHHHREKHDAGPHVRVVALDEPPSSASRHSKIIFQEESEVLAKRLADLKVELYKRNDMLKAAEKVRQQREEEAVRAAAAEKEREARERAEAEAKARAAAEARAAQEKKAQEAVAAKQAEEASQRSVRDLIKLNMQRRAAYAARSKDVDDFVKRFKKMVNGCNLMIQMTGETVQDMKKLGYEGNRKNAGAGTFLSQLQAKKPELIDLGMHVVADRIIRFGTTQTAPDSIKAGETKFALVYLVVTLSINFEGFSERFMESMAHACPYMCPGLREAVIASADGADTDALRAKLGYSAGETNADYIARMQAHVGFLAGVYQTSVSMLSKAPYEMVPPGSKHPCKEGGGLVEAWRWLAMNANRAPNRWTPHLILAFVSVCGFELSRHFPTQMAKLLDLFASADFIDKCKAVAKMDLGDDDNDVDRYTTYTELFTSFAKSSKVRAPGREQDGQDVRQLVLQVASNQAL